MNNKKKKIRKYFNKNELEILYFVYNRLINVHLEPKNVDYMVHFKKIIDERTK